MMKKYLVLALLLAMFVPALAADVSMDSVILIPRTAPGTPTNGQCWTQSTGLFCRINGSTVGPYAVASGVLATPLGTGTSVTLTAPRQYFVCTGACTVTPPVPAAGYEFCVMNDNSVSSVITMAAIGSSARYENTARTAYGTAGTGTIISGGAAGDKICLVGRDATHYLTVSYSGTWTAN